MCSLLLSRGAAVDLRLCVHAVKAGIVDVVSQYLRAGGDANARLDEHLLDVAVSSGHVPVARLLLSAGAVVTHWDAAPNDSRINTLHLAAMRCDAPMVSFLLSEEVVRAHGTATLVNEPSRNGTPLQHALLRLDAGLARLAATREVVDTLLSHGASLDTWYRTQTTMQWAETKLGARYPEIVTDLREHVGGEGGVAG